ncbi:MAG: type II toxin-antitoxin system YafQ family toxin [Chitinophagales bacterium]|nr:type II toxin-antitoxin system YafQ family toxin [Chitinophagales bacterium]
MYQLSTTTQFKKDYKLCQKRGLKLNLLHTAISKLEKTGSLPASYKPHKLTGDYKGFWECHIKPDWLMIWLQDDNSKEITLTRTGTHADLF